MTNIKPTLYFSIDEFQARVAKARAAMQAAELDVVIVSDPSNMNWLTGYDGWSFYVHQCVILGLEDEPIWYGRSMDANGAVRTCFMRHDNIIGYPDNYVQSTERHPMDYLAGQLKERGLANKRIGVEMDNYWFSAAAYMSLVKHLPDATLSDATGLVNWQRAVKSEQELNYMRTAGKIVSGMHKRIVEKVEPGVRKCDIVAEIYDAGLRYNEEIKAGGDYCAFVPMLPSGSDAAAPHLTWDDEPMKAGEGTFFEIGGAYHRYHCPLSRSVFLGTPGDDMLKAEEAVLEGLEAGLDKARAGNKCEDIANAFFGVLKKYGIDKADRVGYAIGASYPPDWGERTMSIRAGDKTVLQPNMTFHFMPGLWMDEWGLEITESIVIREDGAPELLADVDRRLVVKN